MLTIPDRRTFHAIAESPLHRASWDCDLLQAAHTPRQQSVGTAQKSAGSGHPLLPLNGNYQEKRCIRTQWSDRLSGQAVGSQLLSGCVSHASERVLQWDQPTVRSCMFAAKLLAPVPASVCEERKPVIGLGGFLSRLCSSHVSILCIEMWLAPFGHANDCAGCFFDCFNYTRFLPFGCARRCATKNGASRDSEKPRYLRVRMRGLEPPRPCGH